LLGARINGDGITLSPIVEPAQLPNPQVVSTPFGALTINKSQDGNQTKFTFEAQSKFPVELHISDRAFKSDSQSTATI